jgi:hypothetical protein
MFGITTEMTGSVSRGFMPRLEYDVFGCFFGVFGIFGVYFGRVPYEIHERHLGVLT